MNKPHFKDFFILLLILAAFSSSANIQKCMSRDMRCVFIFFFFKDVCGLSSVSYSEWRSICTHTAACSTASLFQSCYALCRWVMNTSGKDETLVNRYSSVSVYIFTVCVEMYLKHLNTFCNYTFNNTYSKVTRKTVFKCICVLKRLHSSHNTVIDEGKKLVYMYIQIYV